MRVLSYNIQAAIGTQSYLGYLSHWHRQLLPSAAKRSVLSDIADYISRFDVVCLQEIDLGGYRNGFASQVEQLLSQTPFNHYLYQINRRVGKLSIHGNLILSRLPLREVVNCALPSRIKGRGMLAAGVDTSNGELVLANVHLSLGATDQLQQLHFIREQLQPFQQVCLVGDFNCTPEHAALNILTSADYQRLTTGMTYPSWQPKKCLDYVFIKGNMNAIGKVSSFRSSDHLPIEVDIAI